MNFAQSANGAHKKTWVSECGNYRIVWRDQVSGVTITPGYHALVRVFTRDQREFWSWVGRRSTYRTLRAAETACRRHQRLWQQFTKLGQAKGNRVARLKQLKETGKYAELPVWVCQAVDDRLVEMFHSR